MGTPSNRANNRKRRRQSRAGAKFGRKAKPRHKSLAGRTGTAQSKVTPKKSRFSYANFLTWANQLRSSYL